MNISFVIRKILWIDSLGALATGLAMLFLSDWLSALYGLSAGFVIGHAFVHLTYGTYSFSLAVRKRRPMQLLLILIFANAAWGSFCLIFVITITGSASDFAVGHFVLEGLYVGTLAVIEWNQREALAISV